MKLKKRILSLLLCGAMLFSLCSQSVLAEENGQAGGVTADTRGLCEHHPEHNADCGYTEGTAGTPCGHEHTADCYEEVTNCVHEHDEDCYPEESVSGNEAAPSGEQKREPTECTHACSEESGCITKELNCQHEHNSECGYSPAAQGTPCGYVCELCGGEDSEKPAAPSNAEAVTVASVQAMIDALPGADEITDDNAEEVKEQLEAIDEAKAQLSDEETDELDFTRYMEAAAALGGLSAPMLTTSGTGEVSTADALTSALADSANETVKLTADITIHATLSVNRTVTLDLNGHVLQYKNDEVHGSPLVVEDGAHLTIQDSGSNETHTFAPNSDGLWVLDENGSETVTGGVITGGKFTGTVINSESGTIAEGVSIPNLKFIVTFDNEGTKTQEMIDAGSKLTEPTAPTKEGYRFDGWYYDNSGTKTKWDFDTDKVRYAMTFTAKWEKTYTVTLNTNGGRITGGNVTEYTYGVGATLPTADDMTYTGHRF